jgi:hypothetical protein
MTVVVERESAERLVCTITASVDPQAYDVLFYFTAVDARPDEDVDAWHEGEWLDESTAQTPPIGAGALDLGPRLWQGWVRIVTPDEDVVRRCGKVRVR